MNSNLKNSNLNIDHTGLNQILQHSTFKKTIKNKYSFPKSQRFPKIKLSNTIDYYEKPSTISKRTCSFGFGNKIDISKAPTLTPSPCNYNTLGDNQQGKNKHGFSFGIGRDELKVGSYLNKGTLDIPSPQKYNLNFSSTKYKNNGTCVLTSRNKYDSFLKDNNNPQPGTYNIGNNQFISKYKSSRRSVFGSAQRFDQPKRDNSLIGPLSYISNPQNFMKKTSCFSFNHAQRKTYAIDAIQKSFSPGPKYYIE